MIYQIPVDSENNEKIFTGNRNVGFHHFDDIITYLKLIFIQKFIKVWKRSKIFLFNLECRSKNFVFKAVNFSWQWNAAFFFLAEPG